MVRLYKNTKGEYICLLGVSYVFPHFNFKNILDICYCNTLYTTDVKTMVLKQNIVDYIALPVANPKTFFNEIENINGYLSISVLDFPYYKLVMDKRKEEKELWLMKNRMVNKDFNDKCSQLKQLDEYMVEAKRELNKYNEFFRLVETLKKSSTLSTEKKEKLKKYHVYVKDLNYVVYMGNHQGIYLDRNLFISDLWDYVECRQLKELSSLDDFYATDLTCNFLKEIE